MQWSQAQKRFELLLAPSLKNRLKVHICEYRNTSGFDLGRGWLTFDGEEIVSVMIPSFYSKNFPFRIDTLNFAEAIIKYINLDIQEIKKSPDELINAFMFLDRRIGKRFIKNITLSSLHPFVRITYLLRSEVEKI